MGREIVILIAEDDRGHFVLIQQYLRNAGIDNEIIWFPDGQQALDFFCNRNDQYLRDEDHKYILLLDIRMPKIDGIELLKQIRGACSDIKNIPVIVVSTSDAPNNVEMCKQLGCIAYIVKPVQKDNSFMEAINNACLAI